MTKARLYSIPQFPSLTAGEIADVRWTYETGTHAKHCGVITEALGLWLDDNPTHWVLAGTYSSDSDKRAVLSGFPASSLYGRGILHVTRGGNVYARSRLELDGMSVEESLQAALEGRADDWAAFDLPRLEKDPFGWTNAELTLAVAVARDWLHPMEELAA